MKRIAIVLALTALPSVAFAGGFEFPDNGAEALGRGATFTAKADSPSPSSTTSPAWPRSVARACSSTANLVFQDFTFRARAAIRSKAAQGMLSYGGQPFPKVSNTAGSFYAPFIALTTDFNYFDRWTFAFGVFGPSAFGNKSWARPCSCRAARRRHRSATTSCSANLLTLFPSLAAAVRVTKWLDMGLALHMVASAFARLRDASVADSARRCGRIWSRPACESSMHGKTTGFTATGGARHS